ncbi:MAG TPA: ABC transporter permease subunit [Mycobacteriales bacterium]|nr:ABC transporter permease subunit [Mycobacteriales bacterium]
MTDATGEPTAAASAAVGTPLLSDRNVPGRRRRRRPTRAPGEKQWSALIFLAPALILLAAVLLYPLVYSVIRSLFSDNSAGGFGSFVGLDNYGHIFSNSSTLRAVRNNVIWVVVVPTVVTFVGLVFAVLSERIRWATALKTVLFMPMAISFLASGITFDLIYADQPSRGLANAVTVGIHDTFAPSSPYPGVHPRDTSVLIGSAHAGYTTKASKPVTPGSVALLPMTGMDLQSPPGSAKQATAPPAGPGVRGVVWNDFRLGGGGTIGSVDPRELGLGGAKVEALQGGKVVATTKADSNGSFAFPDLTSGQYQLRLPASDFAAAYGGLSWLGPNLIVPAMMLAYLWIYAGFAMVLLAAGMSAIPRDALEAARIDGATEWQVFRRVTVPLLAPVLLVVFVTLVINVLKVFDIVFVLEQAAGANAKYGDVLAVSLYDAFGNLHYGLASAIGVLLVLLVIPAMASNIRRFRREQA